MGKNRICSGSLILSRDMDSYIASLKARHYSPRSVWAYRGSLRYFAEFLKGEAVGRVQEITAAHVRQYRRKLVSENKSTATVYSYLRCVCGFMRYCEESGRLLVNPVSAGPGVPSFRRKLQFVPTEDEVRRLLEACDTATALGMRDRAFLELAYSCGLRREELHGLTIHSVDLDQRTLRVLGKGSKERVVPVGRQAVERLKTYLEQGRPSLLGDSVDNALWLNAQGGRLHYSKLPALLKEYRRKAGLNPGLCLHSLRRACATHMLRNGAHPAQIQMLLGHAKFATLGTYLRVSIADLKEAHAASRPGQ